LWDVEAHADTLISIGDFFNNSEGVGVMDTALLVDEPLSLGHRDMLVNRVLRDVYDACHRRSSEIPTLTVDSWD
jgi:hypothetical protein